MIIPHFAGWELLGAYPAHAPDNVGSWLLVHDQEAMLLEIPPGLTVDDVWNGLTELGADLKFVTASHSHEDHLDESIWQVLEDAFPETHFIHPASVIADHPLELCGEPVWLIKAPKLSLDDVVTLFRGVAMTGDIELGMIRSVNREVKKAVKQASMMWLREFSSRHGYHVHSIVSAHLNDVRTSVNWQDLFEC